MTSLILSAEEDADLSLSLEDTASPILLDVFPQSPTFIQTGAILDTSRLTISSRTSFGVGGGRAVGIDNGRVILISTAIASTALFALGVTLAAAAPDTSVEIVVSGLIEDSSWTWTYGKVFIGEAGILTQVVPTTGFILEIGKAIAATKIIINPRIPTILI